MVVRDRDLKTIRRGCTNKQVKALLIGVLKDGARYKLTKSGIILFGPTGSAATHFTVSDHRGVKNLRAQLRRAGLLDQPKGTP